MQALVKAGVTTFQKLRTFDPRRLEIITGRKYPFGNQMKDALEALPPEMAIEVVESEGQQHRNRLYHLTLSRGPSNSSTCKHYGHLVCILSSSLQSCSSWYCTAAVILRQ